MEKFTEIAPSFWVKKSKLYQFNTGIVVGDDSVLLIDPGIYPDEFTEISDFLKSYSEKEVAVLITHSHWDHVLGPEYFPKARVITHTSFTDTVNEYGEGMFKHLLDWEVKTEIKREKKFEAPIPDQILAHKDILDVSPFTFSAIHSPGHARDQLALYSAEHKLLWSADMLSDIEIPYICSNLEDYINTLNYIQTLAIETLIPGHGNWNCEASKIEALIQSDLNYLTELGEKVAACVEQKMSAKETLAECASIPLRVNRDKGPHSMNIETVFSELGGDTGGKLMGWATYVETGG